MARQHTPEELAEAQRILKERAPFMKKMMEEIQKEKAEASETIRMLENRVKTKAFELDLDDGAKIGVRTNLSVSEIQRLDEIRHTRGEIQTERINLEATGNLEDPVVRKQLDDLNEFFDDLWLELIAIITVDEQITFRWLKKHPESYSREDTLSIYLAYLEGQKQLAEEREERVKNATSFRNKPVGAGIRDVTDKSGDQGSGGVEKPAG